MADTTAQLQACKAAASVRDTDLIAEHTISSDSQGLVLTMLAELPVAVADSCQQG